MEQKKRFSIKRKVYVFVIITVLIIASGTAAIAYYTQADQINRYYKRNTSSNARNFASMVDGDYLKELREAAASDEFQALREQAEEEENEALIQDYLEEHGLWDKYRETQDMLQNYFDNMDDIKYLYIIAHGDINDNYDMYLVDDKTIPIYETGYYEKREEELRGIDLTNMPEPTISNGDWGWLCSDFKPVYASDGTCVCIVGCDIGMNDVVAERQNLLVRLLLGAIIFACIVLVGAFVFINKIVVQPIDAMTREMKKFNPSDNLTYEDSGVMNIDIKSNDEISDIYNGIRDMQINIIDYLKNMESLQEENQRAENDIKNKEEQIDQLNIETYKDALTGVGNKASYIKKVSEMTEADGDEKTEFALVMVDINDLKKINDDYGHRSGDLYIKGCCHMICEAFKHSPIYRIGGDEFVAVLMGHDFENRLDITNKLKEDYKQTHARNDVSPWERYSAAVGMAEYSFIDNTVELVFKRADEAMYKDKAIYKSANGGNTR